MSPKDRIPTVIYVQGVIGIGTYGKNVNNENINIKSEQC